MEGNGYKESRESEALFVVVMAIIDPPASVTKPKSFCPVTLVPEEIELHKAKQKLYSFIQEWKRRSSHSKGTSSPTQKEPSLFTDCDATSF